MLRMRFWPMTASPMRAMSALKQNKKQEISFELLMIYFTPVNEI